MNVILVGYDGTPEAEDALALGRMLARQRAGRVIAAYAYPFDPALEGKDAGDWGSMLRTEAERLIESLPAGAYGDVDVERRVVPSRSPAQALERLAEDLDADLLVVGSCHRGTLGRILIGSVGDSLLRGSPTAVAVAPRGMASAPPEDPRVIVVGYDGSRESEIALRAAETLALDARATLRVVSAVETHGFAGLGVGYGYADLIGLIDARQREELDKAIAKLDPAVRAEAVLRHGEPAAALAAEADAGGDMIVVGSRGHGPVQRALAGSVAVRLLRIAPVPVVITCRGATHTMEHSEHPNGVSEEPAQRASHATG